MPMHALWKTFFFTTGAVGLLLLVFIWSALHYGLFSLNHFISSVLSIKFAGYTLPEYLTIPSNLGAGEKVYHLKTIFSIILGAGSLILILTSYLPRISWQFRFISSVATIILFSALLLFWQCKIGRAHV